MSPVISQPRGNYYHIVVYFPSVNILKTYTCNVDTSIHLQHTHAYLLLFSKWDPLVCTVIYLVLFHLVTLLAFPLVSKFENFNNYYTITYLIFPSHRYFFLN